MPLAGSSNASTIPLHLLTVVPPLLETPRLQLAVAKTDWHFLI
jgi:hypothetical protein